MITRPWAVAAASLLCLPLLASLASANTHSEYLGGLGIDDICNATDPDGIGPSPSAPTHDDSCNASDAAHGGPDSLVAYQYSTFNGGVAVSCQDAPPSAANAGTGTTCAGGHSSNADTVPNDAAYLGADFPLVSDATFAPQSTTSASAWSVRAIYRDTLTGITGNTLGPVICVPIGGTITVAAGAGGAADPPVGTTITGIVAWMQSDLGCGTITGRLAPQETRVTYGYMAEANGNAANAAVVPLTVTPDPALPGTCTVTWSASASVPAGTLGRAEVLVTPSDPARGGYYDGGVVAGSNVNAGGTRTAFVGDNVEVTASAWSIGNTYAFSRTGPIACVPTGPPPGIPYGFGPVVIKKASSGAPFLAQSQPGCAVALTSSTSMQVACSPPVTGSWLCNNPGLVASADTGSLVTGNTWCTGGPVKTATSNGGPAWSGIATGVWQFAWYCEAIFATAFDSGYVLCDAPDPPLLWPL